MTLNEQIKFLSGRRPSLNPVVSFYLDVDGSRYSPIQCIARTRHLIQTARHNLYEMSLSGPAKVEVEAGLDQITQLVGTQVEWGKSRGLVIFVGGEDEVWQVIELPVSVIDSINMESIPHLRPLLELLQDYPRYAVVLVNQRQARFFIVDIGAIAERETLREDVPRRTHSGSYYGLSDKKYERHVDVLIDTHYRHVAGRIVDLTSEVLPQCVMIGGSVDSITGTKRMLPTDIARQVCAEISLPITAATTDVLSETILASHTRCRNAADVFATQVVDSSLGGGLGSFGIDATLSALHLREVGTLVLDRRFVHPGFVCQSCARIFAHRRECPACGSVARLAISDLGEAATSSAIQQDAAVKHVFGSIAFLSEGIGALLRFRADSQSSESETHSLALSA